MNNGPETGGERTVQLRQGEEEIPLSEALNRVKKTEAREKLLRMQNEETPQQDDQRSEGGGGGGDESEGTVQQKSSGSSGGGGFDLSSYVSNSAGGGKSMDAPVQAKMESSFGSDFSSVGIHDNSQSHQADSSIGAKAFTSGQDIHFGSGQYNPSSSAGSELLSHEMARTVQQKSGGTSTQASGVSVGPASDSYEKEADSAAQSVSRGEPVGNLSSLAGGVQRMIQRSVYENAAPNLLGSVHHDWTFSTTPSLSSNYGANWARVSSDDGGDWVMEGPWAHTLSGNYTTKHKLEINYNEIYDAIWHSDVGDKICDWGVTLDGTRVEDNDYNAMSHHADLGDSWKDRTWDSDPINYVNANGGVGISG